MVTIWEIFAFFGISYTFAVVSLGVILIGFQSGIMSVLFVNQRRAIIGDTLAHTTLPGIALIFLLVQEKNRLLLMLGALITALLAVTMIQLISRRSSLKQDVAIGVSMSIFTSLGIAFLTYIQRLSISEQAGLTHYMFGNITFLLRRELITVSILTLIVLVTVYGFYKEFKLILFDREYAKSLGLPVAKLESLLLVLVTFAIVLSIENMGILLIAGLLIGPAIAARYWSDNFGKVMIIAGFVGSMSGIFGVIASSAFERTPPGPAIIIALSGIVIFSAVFSPTNGLLSSWIHNRIYHRRINHAQVIQSFVEKANGLLHESGLRVFEFELDQHPDLDPELINTLCGCGFCKKLSDQTFVLTYKGVRATQKFILR